MARSEQTDIFISRLLALFFAVASAMCLLILVGGYAGIIASVFFACLTLLVFGSIRSRVGARSAYSHPLSRATLTLLCFTVALSLLAVFFSLRK
jgi:hypothetical protein